MKKLILQKAVLLVMVAAVCGLTGCASTQKEAEEVQNVFVKEAKLCELAAPYGFKVGTCFSIDNAGRKSYNELMAGDFNTVTATNEFKAYSLLSQTQSIAEGVPSMNYKRADFMAKAAQKLGIGIRGHVLVWDAYMPDWFFREGFRADGEFVSSDVMKERLRYYIKEVVAHFETNFPGLVYCWDVVNEAVADGANEQVKGNEFHLRKTRSGSKNLFYDVIGEDYVEFSFRCAREAVNEVNPSIKLFYNDYNTFYADKRDAIIRLVKKLNAEEKLCDGVGMQGYIGGYGSQAGCMNPNDIRLIKEAIEKYKALGIEVQLTEVAVRNYDGSESAMERHAEFYGNLFKMLKSVNADGKNQFTGITIWGITDRPGMDENDYSYKMNGPYCGLYTKEYKPKESYKKVYSVLKE